VVGFSDQALYRWKKAGGAFSFTARPPADGDPRMAAALQSMRSHARLFVQTHPIAALERIAEDLGLWALASLGDDPNTGAGMVATAFELLRSDGDRLVGISQVAARLGRHIDQYESDPYPVRPETGEAVRIMNLHQTKGLEAPVVFLTCTREMKTKHATQIAVARTIFGSEAALAVFGGERNSLKLAQPGDWEKRAGEEELFLAAEKTRLRYVAATRAGAALIVSVYRTSEGEWKSAFLAEPFDPDLILPNPLPEPEPGSVRPNLDGIATEPDAAVPDQFAAQREENLRALLTPSYGTARAKDGADSSPEPVDTVAVRFGEALHALLEQPAADDRLLENARHWLREYELDIEPEVAVDMIRQVRSSPLWRRAAAAESAFRETPFTLRGDGNTLVRGVIDLVFKEDGGWVLVDYKSDAIPASVSAASAAEKHREQLHAYRAAWSSLTGEPVKETGIYFLRRSEYIVLE
ncbi:MAG: PD-(D/E)XK nuclease family protein, partial [Planctomycetes bacterium]|nr:PD-(D/E)XK nuclease family protein [Planctomycetota bacterium]